VFEESGEEIPSGEIGLDERDLTVKAPMPGTVIKILVSPGQRLKKGEPLAIVEAMKMENVVRSPGEAIVVRLLTQPGQQVGFGEELLKLAPPQQEDAPLFPVD
ncbi:MAG: acetyl-CoA carboxylase biotin carboxyl carrier protein subunit, partial [bacterium]